jgi:hypothetical protein
MLINFFFKIGKFKSYLIFIFILFIYIFTFIQVWKEATASLATSFLRRTPPFTTRKFMHCKFLLLKIYYVTRYILRHKKRRIFLFEKVLIICKTCGPLSKFKYEFREKFLTSSLALTRVTFYFVAL